ncbi:hypothetical protein DYD21_13980 [Rhodohalobacter sp. SW132]|nr:hypothetical protein DYD21_13980 [Rhodohalobacter sp. SW132]
MWGGNFDTAEFKIMERRKQDFIENEVTRLLVEEDVQCLIFRTSLQNRDDVEKISTTLDNLEGLSDWHVDLDDWEKVLRIVCTGLSAESIIKTLFRKGFIAEEIPTN